MKSWSLLWEAARRVRVGEYSAPSKILDFFVPDVFVCRVYLLFLGGVESMELSYFMDTDSDWKSVALFLLLVFLLCW